MTPTTCGPLVPLSKDNVQQIPAIPHQCHHVHLSRFLSSLPSVASPPSLLPPMAKVKSVPPKSKTKSKSKANTTKGVQQEEEANDEEAVEPPPKPKPTRPRKKSRRDITPPPTTSPSDDSETDDGASEREKRRQAKALVATTRRIEATRLTKLYGHHVPVAWIDDDGRILSQEEILDHQVKGWKSRVYTHFTRPTITGVGKNTTYVFGCTKHKDRSVRRKRSDTSTGNLGTHIRPCDPKFFQTLDGESVSGTTSTTEMPVGFTSAYTPARLRVGIVEWVTSANRPISIYRDPGLMSIFKMLNSSVELPSRQTASRDIVTFHSVTKVLVGKFLNNLNSSLTVGVDGWTAPTSMSWVAVVVHFIAGGQMQKLLLDFVRVSGSHTGLHLSNSIGPLIVEFGIHKQVIAVVADGAPNNDTMCDHLPTHLSNFSGRDSKVTCFAHTINLIVGCLLKPFSKGKVEAAKQAAAAQGADESEDVGMEGTEEEDEEDEDVDLMMDALQEADLVEMALHDADKLAFESNEAQTLLEETMKELQMNDEAPFTITPSILLEARQLVPRLTTLATKMRYNGAVKSKFESIIASSSDLTDTSQTTVPRPVATRWSSTGEMIEAAVDLESPVRQLFAVPKLPLKKAVLSNAQWKMAVDLAPILSAFSALISTISQTNVPMVHQIIKWLDFIQTGLDRNRCLESNHVAVRFACVIAQRMLNKAYSNTDKTWVIRHAMILHPNLKTSYFKKQDWPPLWQKNALEALQEMWVAKYAPKDSDEVERPKKPLPKGSKGTAADVLMRFAGSSTTPLGTRSFDELASYLNEPAVEEDIANVLDWWTLKAKTHPRLARMAKDILSIPMSSVDVERVFKRGRDTISYKRHSLGDKTVRASLAFGDWVKYPGLVPSGLLAQLTADNTRRGATRLTPEKAIAAINDDTLDELLKNATAAPTPALSVVDEEFEGEGLTSDVEEDGGEQGEDAVVELQDTDNDDLP